jgi:probable rRNA maturation factor
LWNLLTNPLISYNLFNESSALEREMSGKDLGFKIDWSSRSKMRGPGEQSLGDMLRKLRDHLAPQAEGISISYVDDRAMRKLNREHRGINMSTDVLSFPAKPGKGEFQHLGDLVVCLPYAEKMAKKLGVSRRREVQTLLIHGFLHLCGYDHEKDKGEMLEMQASLEKEVLGEAPLPMALKRGRKAGSKVKLLKDGRRVVVTGRAAVALSRSAKAGKSKKPKEKLVKVSKEAKRGPGRPKKTVQPPPPKRPPRRKAVRARGGVIA